MLLPNQVKPLARILDAAVAATRAGLVSSALPHEDKPISRVISPGIVDPCQAMCAGSKDPNCWRACGDARSPWIS